MLLTSLYPHRRYPASPAFGIALGADLDPVEALLFERSGDGAAGSRTDAAHKGTLRFDHPRLTLTDRQRLEQFYIWRRTRPFYLAAGETRLVVFSRPPAFSWLPGQRFAASVEVVEI